MIQNEILKELLDIFDQDWSELLDQVQEDFPLDAMTVGTLVDMAYAALACELLLARGFRSVSELLSRQQKRIEALEQRLQMTLETNNLWDGS